LKHLTLLEFLFFFIMGGRGQDLGLRNRISVRSCINLQRNTCHGRKQFDLYVIRLRGSTTFIEPNSLELCEIGNPLELPLPFIVPPALNDRSNNGHFGTSSSSKVIKFRSCLFTLNKSHHPTKNQQDIRSIRKQ